MSQGGKMMQKIREDSGASVRIASTDQIPPCAFPGDVVIQITGKFLTVKNALLLITNCLQESDAPPTWDECPFPQPGYPPEYHSMDYHQWDHPPPNPMPEDVGSFNRPVVKEEVVFRLLCPADKVGSLIGKGGAVVRALQNETGASIKVSDPAHDIDERIVVISARELVIDGHPVGMVPPDVNHGFALRNEPIGSENPVMTSANMEIVVPQAYLGHVYGENCSNLNYIKQVSGANVVVHDPKAGTTGRTGGCLRYIRASSLCSEPSSCFHPLWSILIALIWKVFKIIKR